MTVIPGGLVAYKSWAQQSYVMVDDISPSGWPIRFLSHVNHDSGPCELINTEAVFDAAKNRAYVLVRLLNKTSRQRINLEFES